tara:strand:- start:1348 stop:1743 length:396 start_codon:yes stop_codon:yes gene_type:complete
MAKRDTPNDYFSWYNDDDRLAIVVKQTSTVESKGVVSGEYDTYLDSTVTNGIKITVHSKYEAVDALSDDLESTSGLNEAIHPYVLDYVKSRLLEDRGDLQSSERLRIRYEKGVGKTPSRKSGVRVLLVPPL